MGSISSRPKALATSQPAVVYVPAPTPAPAPVTSGAQNTPSESAGGETQSSGQTESQIRTANLLQRNRGRFGTVLTGFRGLLGKTNANAGRKTLLGE